MWTAPVSFTSFTNTWVSQRAQTPLAIGAQWLGSQLLASPVGMHKPNQKNSKNLHLLVRPPESAWGGEGAAVLPRN